VELEKKQRKVNYAKWWGTANSLEEAQKEPMPSCEELQKLSK
jgi:hypothetical protein